MAHFIPCVLFFSSIFSVVHQTDTKSPTQTRTFSQHGINDGLLCVQFFHTTIFPAVHRAPRMCRSFGRSFFPALFLQFALLTFLPKSVYSKSDYIDSTSCWVLRFLSSSACISAFIVVVGGTPLLLLLLLFLSSFFRFRFLRFVLFLFAVWSCELWPYSAMCVRVLRM